MIKIKANEELFNEIKTITLQMNDFLPSIVQNDMEISKEEYIEFWEDYEKYINKIDDWMLKIKGHINSPYMGGKK